MKNDSSKNFCGFSLNKIDFIFVLLLVSVCLSACSKRGTFGPPKEKMLKLGIDGKVVTLDPHMFTDVYSGQVQSLTYESLFQYHFLKRPFEVIPALAEKLPEISADGKKWVFTLKKGIRFQDDPCFEASGGKGRELVAEDYVNYFKRIAQPNPSSPHYSVFEPVVMGLSDYKNGKSKEISGVRALDKYRFEVKLVKKSPRFLYNFLSSSSAPLPMECVAYYGDKLSSHTVGTGPFVIKESNSNNYVAVKNPNFREELYPSEGAPGDKERGLLEDAGKRLPLVDRVEVEVIEESQPRWLKFMSGELSVSGVPKDNMDTAFNAEGKLSEELAKKGVQHFRELGMDITMMIFNMKDPVWGKHKELRQAFALARDVDQYIKVAYGGFAVPAHFDVMPGMYGFEAMPLSRWYPRNLDKAKELFSKAGFPEGRGLSPISMPNMSSTTIRQSMELLIRQFKEVGVVLNYEPMSWPELSKRSKEGVFGISFIGFVADVPDPESSLPILHSRSIPPNGQNYGRYMNPKYDRLVEEIEEMDNGPERLAKIKQAVEILQEDLPVIPLAHRVMNQLYQPWVRNATAAAPMFSYPWMKYRGVKTAQ